MDKYKEELLNQGYCVVPNVISKKCIEKLRSIYLKAFDESGLVTIKPSEFLQNNEVSDIIFSTDVIPDPN